MEPNKNMVIELASSLTNALCDPKHKKDALKVIAALMLAAHAQGDEALLSVLTSAYAILSSHELTIEQVMEHEEETADTLRKTMEEYGQFAAKHMNKAHLN